MWSKFCAESFVNLCEVSYVKSYYVIVPDHMHIKSCYITLHLLYFAHMITSYYIIITLQDIS